MTIAQFAATQAQHMPVYVHVDAIDPAEYLFVGVPQCKTLATGEDLRPDEGAWSC
jgi:hypothetical protein